MRTVLPFSALILALAAHSAPPASADTTPMSGAPVSARAPASRSVPKHVLPWIEDDWTRAVALARQRKVPIFVESWAPW